jgi:hypothetical protein
MVQLGLKLLKKPLQSTLAPTTALKEETNMKVGGFSVVLHPQECGTSQKLRNSSGHY